MSRQFRIVLCLSLLGILGSGYSRAADGAAAEVDEPVPSYADAAVVLTKYAGFFDRYVSEDMEPAACVSFLNKIGIYFGMLEVVTGADFLQSDCARVMGQMELVFSGEARYVSGKVVLPEGIQTWEDYCVLNDVKYLPVYKAMRKMLLAANQKSI